MAIDERQIIATKEKEERMKSEANQNRTAPFRNIWESIENIIDSLESISKNKSKGKDDDGWLVMGLSHPYNLCFKTNYEGIILSDGCGINNIDGYGICVCYRTDKYNEFAENHASKIYEYYSINGNALEQIIENILIGRCIVQGLKKIGSNKVSFSYISMLLDFVGIKSYK